jgi:ADP-heptose:LPS heptosyltransferase
VLWQLGASTPIRSYRPDLARRAMELLLAARPGLDILATGTAAEFAAYEPLPQGVIRVRGQKLRTVFALCLQAVCTVAPDSVMVHAAGGLRRPCVGLWGSFSPRWRASYYPEHRALVGEAPCAPCATHECGAQEEGCPRRMGRPADDRYCEAIAGIAPETVVAAVLEIAG